MVAEQITEDAEGFFLKLLSTTTGFYFLEADEYRDMEYLRAYDYRNSTAAGIQLYLASELPNKTSYLQAIGRTKRGGDHGNVHTLPKKMYN